MNFPFIKWNKADGVVYPEITSGDTIDNQNQASSIINLTEKHLMMQLITEPTREKNVLDLLFSNQSDEIFDISVEKVSNTISDHNFVYFSIPGEDNPAKTPDKTANPNAETGLNEFQFWSDESQWENVKQQLLNTLSNKYDSKNRPSE